MSPKPILPPRLHSGARVALITPSGPLLERDHSARGAELCRALGYEPVLMPNAGRAHGYFAGTDGERLADLNAALTDPAIDAVWCLRGGNGMNRIVDRVDFDGVHLHVDAAAEEEREQENGKSSGHGQHCMQETAKRNRGFIWLR